MKTIKILSLLGLFVLIIQVQAQENLDKMDKLIVKDKIESAFNYCIKKLEKAPCDCKELIAEKANKLTNSTKISTHFLEAAQCYVTEKKFDKALAIYSQFKDDKKWLSTVKLAYQDAKSKGEGNNKYAHILIKEYMNSGKQIFESKTPETEHKIISNDESYLNFIEAAKIYIAAGMNDSITNIGKYLLSKKYKQGNLNIVEDKVLNIYNKYCNSCKEQFAFNISDNIILNKLDYYAFTKSKSVFKIINILKEVYANDEQKYKDSLNSLAKKIYPCRKQLYEATENYAGLASIYKLKLRKYEPEKYDSRLTQKIINKSKDPNTGLWLKNTKLAGDYNYESKNYKQALVFYNEIIKYVSDRIPSTGYSYTDNPYMKDYIHNENLARIHLYLSKKGTENNSKSYYYYHKLKYWKYMTDDVKLKELNNEIAHYFLAQNKFQQANGYFLNANNETEVNKLKKSHPELMTDQGDGTVNIGNVFLVQKDQKENINWLEAKAYCETLTLAGKKWQLPKDLAYLRSQHDDYPAKYAKIFGKTKRAYWTNRISKSKIRQQTVFPFIFNRKFTLEYGISPNNKSWRIDDRIHITLPLCVKCISYDVKLIKEQPNKDEEYLKIAQGKSIE